MTATGASGFRARWAGTPRWARGLALYVASALAALALGGLTPLGVGNALFGAGAVWLFVSMGFIGLGREHRVVVHRSIEGAPRRKERVAAPELRARNLDGLMFFIVALALWASLLVGRAW